ncbi:MAG: tRNA pseudouridine(13) synthase TruD [Candidatus Micrarchaeia archaeon]
MYKIKENPEDFVVDEILSDGTFVSESYKKDGEGNGAFVWVGVKKVNWNTIDLAREIAKRMGVSEKRVNYGGIKDRVAVAYQVFSINTRENCEAAKETINRIKDVKVIGCWRSNRWIKNEDFVGNRFEITLRECDTDFGKIKRIDKFPNYFGEQRFGSIRQNSHVVGLYLLKGDYDSALKEYFSGELDMKEKEMYEKSKRYGAEKFIKTYWRVFNLCLSAFQSRLFNEEVEMRIRDGRTGVLKGEYACGRNKLGFADVGVEGNEFTVVQLVGGKCIVNEYKSSLLQKYKLETEDFEKAGLKGGWRTLYAPILWEGIENICEEKKGNTVRLKFMLQKGSYATVAIRSVMGDEISI